MASKKPMTGEDRKAKLLDAGAKLASKYGAVNVTRRMVAEACKCADGLVSHYMGGTSEAQAAYKKHMKKLKLSEPTKDKIEALGVKLRAKGPRAVKSTRKRSIREVKAIKRNVARPKGRSRVGAAVKAAGGKVITKKSAGNKIAGKKVTGVVLDDGAIQASVPKPKRVRPSRAKPKPAPEENKAIPGAPENKAARLPKAPPPGQDATA